MASREMIEIIIVFTRCRGNGEWEAVWNMNDSNWFAIFNNSFLKSEYNNTSINENTDDIKLIVFDGTANERYGDFSKFLSRIDDKKFIVAIHPGGRTTLGAIKKDLCSAMPDIKNIINAAVEYTLGNVDILKLNHPVANFARSPSQDNFKKLRHFILYNMRNPYLIAFSILCQGYLAAHGQNDTLHGWECFWKNLPIDLQDDKFQLKTRSETEGRRWWEPALGNNYSGKELENELFDSNKSGKKIKELIESIRDNKNEMLIADTQQRENFTNLVNEAYKNLTEILMGSGLNKETASN